MIMTHHVCIYDLCMINPLMPLSGYCKELELRFGFNVSQFIIFQWFKTIGPFKGSMRLTSHFPSGRNSDVTYQILDQYLIFMSVIPNHSRLIFADKKNNERNHDLW